MIPRFAVRLVASLAALLALSLSAPAGAAPGPDAPKSAQRVPDRAFVLPLQPGPGMTYDGLGPALQNVIENVLALSPALEETWLMRSLREAFPTAGDLQAYMLGLRAHPSPFSGLAREGARHIVSGYVLEDGRAEVRFLDLATGASGRAALPVDADAGLTAFKRGLLEFLRDKAGVPFPQVQAAKALAPERTSPEALKAFGLSYGASMLDSHVRAGGRIALPLGLRAAEAGPESPMAGNMLGWQHFAGGDLARAEARFREALRASPDMVDALDGMMQCTLRLGGIEAASPWARRKARARGADIGQALSQLHLAAGHMAMDSRNPRAASARYRTAWALNPSGETAAMQHALSLEAARQYDAALAVMDDLASRCELASLKARALNFKARLARFMSRSHRQEGRPDEERRCLDMAVSFLRESPAPDLREYSLAMRRLASMAMERGDAASAVGLLGLIRPEKNTDRLALEAMLAHALARGGQDGRAREAAASCVAGTAERARTREHVPAFVYRQLAEAYSVLGDKRMEQSMLRQAGEER